MFNPDHLFAFLEQMLPLTQDERDAILRLDIFKEYPKGTVLLKAGQVSDDYYFVVKGCFRTYFIQDGEEKCTGFYTEFENHNPLCVGTGKPSTYYIECLEDSMLVVARPDMEQRLFQEFPKFESLCRIQAERLLAKSQEEFNAFKFSSAEKRYLGLMESRPHILQRVPQHMIASYLGIQPESLSRIRKRLAKAKAA